MGKRWAWQFGLRLLLALAAFAATAAPAAPPRADAGQPCIRASTQPLDPYQLLEAPERFDCTSGRTPRNMPYVWGLYRNLSLVNDPADPWELRHEYSQADAETVYVRYANGATIQAPSDRASARRLFSPGMVAFALPPERGRITSVLVRVDGLRNQRGIAPSAEFKTGRAAMEGDLVVLWLYGLLAGIVGALLIYNFAVRLPALHVHPVLLPQRRGYDRDGAELVGWHSPAVSRPRHDRTGLALHAGYPCGAGLIGAVPAWFHRARQAARLPVGPDETGGDRRPWLVSGARDRQPRPLAA